MLKETRLALDLSLYSPDSSPEILAADIASLFTEARPRRPQINIDLNTAWWFDRFPKNLNDSPDQRPSSFAGLDTERLVNQTPENSSRLVVLVSPPDPHLEYPESRIDVYLASNSSGHISFDGFGLPAVMDSRQIEELFNSFRLASDYSRLPPLSGPDLLLTPLCLTFPRLLDSRDFMAAASQALPLPLEIWDAIADGQIKHQTQQKTSAAIDIARQSLDRLHTGQHPLLVGAYAETLASRVYGSISSRESGCGATNTDVLTGMLSLQTNSLYASQGAKSHQESKHCPEIKCQECGWKPDEDQLTAIREKRLTKCPKCHPEAAT